MSPKAAEMQSDPRAAKPRTNITPKRAARLGVSIPAEAHPPSRPNTPEKQDPSPAVESTS
jgi:hypothetical protein